jgi:uncharacterized protein Yka (UPF0111/DUF47 family)
MMSERTSQCPQCGKFTSNLHALMNELRGVIIEKEEIKEIKQKIDELEKRIDQLKVEIKVEILEELIKKLKHDEDIRRQIFGRFAIMM